MMDKILDSNKTSIRPDYKPCSNVCYICKKTGKKKSKKFNTLYGLKFHLSSHTREDEIVAGVTRRQILHTVRAISRALDWNMLVDLSKVQS
jgi:hypothetical protein